MNLVYEEDYDELQEIGKAKDLELEHQVIQITEEDNMKEHYIEGELQQAQNDIHLNEVHPAIVYPTTPKTPGRKEEIETILNERGIQVVWRT